MEDILMHMPRRHDHLICVDSDGTIFDTMAVKQKECFYPATEKVWELEYLHDLARETALFVSLTSTTRGINRYPALVRTFRLLSRRPEALERGYEMPDITALERWIEATPSLSRGALEKYMAALDRPEPTLEKTLRWVQEADRNIERLVRGIPPFPFAKEALKELSAFADIVVVSTATHEDLSREWGEQGLLPYVTAVAGQELGSKKGCIQKAKGDHYADDRVLMIGDAPGDLKAAREAGALFYPILPGKEAESWQKMLRETAQQLRDDAYTGAPMQKALDEFSSLLLKDPPWPEIPDR